MLPVRPEPLPTMQGWQCLFKLYMSHMIDPLNSPQKNAQVHALNI